MLVFHISLLLHEFMSLGDNYLIKTKDQYFDLSDYSILHSLNYSLDISLQLDNNSLNSLLSWFTSTPNNNVSFRFYLIGFKNVYIILFIL